MGFIGLMRKAGKTRRHLMLDFPANYGTLENQAFWKAPHYSGPFSLVGIGRIASHGMQASLKWYLWGLGRRESSEDFLR